MGLHLGLTLGNAQPVGPASSITIDTAPTITGTAEVGETLTRTVGSYSGDGTITVSNGRWTRNGVDIAGATGATYTLVAADDETTVRWYEDVADAGSGDTLESPSNGLYVTYAAPVATGSILDQDLTHTGDEVTVVADVTALFSGADLSYAVSGYAGARIDGVALKVDPTAVVTGQTVTLTASNSGGSDSITFDLTVEALAFTAASLTGTGKIGATHTAAATLNRAGASLSYDYERDGVSIGATDQATYVPVSADDLTTLSVVIEATLDGVTIQTEPAGIAITYTAPTAAGGLSDQSFTEDTGAQTYDVSGDFTNAAGGTWSLPTTIAGVTINSSGVVSFNTDTLALQTGTSIVARYTNSGGFADSGFSLTIAEDTTPALSATLDGEMEIDGSGDISLTVTAPSDYAGGPYTTDQSTAATGNLNTTSIETGPQCAVAPAISRTSGASDTVGAVYTRVSGLWLYDGDDTLTLAGEWYLDGAATGETGATYTSDTAGDVDWRDSASGAGATRTAISNEITVAAAATAPAQMSAPTVTATGSDSISVDRAAAPSDGGSAITSYDLRHSTDESTWTTVTGISDPETVSSLAASTLYYVQTRAVNAVGAGAWSTSGTATTTGAADPAAALISLWGSDLIALIDLTDQTTMYQGYDTTTPVTANGQTVGYVTDKSGNGNHLKASEGQRGLSAAGYMDFNNGYFFLQFANSFAADSGIAALIDPNGDTGWILAGNLLDGSKYTGVATDGSSSAVDSGFSGTIVHAVENVDLTSPDRNDIHDAVAAEGGWAIQSARGIDLSLGELYFAPLSISTLKFSGNVKYIVVFKNATGPKLASQQTILDGAK